MSDVNLENNRICEVDRLPYSAPKLQSLGRVAELTLGGSGGVAEAGSDDENEDKP